MFDDESDYVSVEMVKSVKIRVHDQKCIVTDDMWSKACDVLDLINEYTHGQEVHKVQTIKMVRAASNSGLREAKLMTEAYFEPTFQHNPDKGWYKYT